MTGHVQEKITPHHHEHYAYVYVRQSTLKQVHQHHEGRQNQYALVQRALALGWPPERVRVIDADLARISHHRTHKVAPQVNRKDRGCKLPQPRSIVPSADTLCP